MIFPQDWTRRVAITIPAVNVNGTSGQLSGFPLLLTEAALPQEMFDADGPAPAQDGGGDIRASLDTGGTIPLALEIVNFVTDTDPANGQAEIWVSVPSLDKSADTTLYLWYGGDGTAVQPPAADPAGRHAVWSDYLLVYHGDGLSDSSGNQPDLTPRGFGEISGSSGKIGRAFECTGSAQQGWRIDAANGQLSAGEPVHVEFWELRRANVSQRFEARVIEWTNGGSDGFAIAHDSPDFLMGFTFGQNTSEANLIRPALDSWEYFSGEFDQSADEFRWWRNGALAHTVTGYTDNTTIPAGSELNIATARTGAIFDAIDGKFDEIRLRQGLVDADRVATQYGNQNDPGGFSIAGTPIDVSQTGGGSTLVIPAAEHAHIVADAVMAQQHVLGVDGAAQIQSASVADHDQIHRLAVPAHAHAHLSEMAVLTAVPGLVVTGAIHDFIGGTVLLGQSHGLAILGGFHQLDSSQSLFLTDGLGAHPARVRIATARPALRPGGTPRHLVARANNRIQPN